MKRSLPAVWLASAALMCCDGFAEGQPAALGPRRIDSDNQILLQDEITRRLLTSRGEVEDNGAIGVYIAHPTAEKMAALSAAVFLGASLRCAE